MTPNSAEREAIGLCIAVEAIDSIVNHSLLELRDDPSMPGETQVYYQSGVHQQLFTILLLDLVHERGDETLTGVSGSCLSVLKEACRSQSFSHGDSVDRLLSPLQIFRAWLDESIRVSLWLPSLDLQVDLGVRRLDFLYTSGNRSKHNLSRLTGVSKRLAEILSANGYSIAPDQVLLAVEDFYAHFHADYLVYYGTWLAEMLNNIRWGVQDYLLPQFHLSCMPNSEEPGRCSYRFPDSIIQEGPRGWYWRLMNTVRSGPNLRRFVASSTSKREIRV